MCAVATSHLLPPMHSFHSKGLSRARGACAELGAGAYWSGPATVVGSGQSARADRRGRLALRFLLLRYSALAARVTRTPEDQSGSEGGAHPPLRGDENARGRAVCAQGGDAAAAAAVAPPRLRRWAWDGRAGLWPANGDRAGPGSGRKGR